MITLPPEFQQQISVFAPVFSKKVFEHAKILLLGSILTIGKRTISSALRAVGLQNEKRFHKYHRVLSTSKWSAFQASRILLNLIVDLFVAKDQAIVLGLDETLERRRGKKIKAKAVYRDAVRSSKSQMVKSTGLRWICMMVLTKISWTNRIWALPFFTLLAPSERYNRSRNREHRTITEWAFIIIQIVKRWLPNRKLIVLGDGSYSVINFLSKTSAYASVICPLRLDARLFNFPLPQPKGKRGPKPKIGSKQAKLETLLHSKSTLWIEVTIPLWYNHPNAKLLLATGTSLWYNSNWGKTPVPLRWVLIKDPNGKIKPKALLSTDLELDPEQIINYYIQRWSVEVTFQEVRKHLGVETQRQWSDLAIARTTPALMGIFSLVTIWTEQLHRQNLLTINSSAWYQKTHPTFSDAIASLRLYIWRSQKLKTSSSSPDVYNFDPNILELIINLATQVA
jgi:hypothetical protein